MTPVNVHVSKKEDFKKFKLFSKTETDQNCCIKNEPRLKNHVCTPLVMV
jgi:hypothetical protein